MVVSGLVIKSCPMLVTPWTVVHQVPLSMGLFRQEYWSGLPVPPPGDLPNPGIKPMSPAWQVDSLPLTPPEKPEEVLTVCFFFKRLVLIREAKSLLW